MNWSVWEHEKVKAGDRFFMLRVGEGKTGIVAYGDLDSESIEGEDWSGRGRQTFYVWLYPYVIMPLNSELIIPTATLQEAIPNFDWAGGHSGMYLNTRQEEQLMSLWDEAVLAKLKV